MLSLVLPRHWQSSSVYRQPVVDVLAFQRLGHPQRAVSTHHHPPRRVPDQPHTQPHPPRRTRALCLCCLCKPDPALLDTPPVPDPDPHPLPPKRSPPSLSQKNIKALPPSLLFTTDLKSTDTRGSSHTARTPFMGPLAASLKALLTSSAKVFFSTCVWLVCVRRTAAAVATLGEGWEIYEEVLGGGL